MKSILLLLLVITSLLDQAAGALISDPAYCKWVICYNGQAQTSDFQNFDPIVLDADCHPAVLPIVALEKTVLGYISLGEVGSYRYYFHDIQNASILISENPTWPGSWYVDIRNPYWRDLMIDTVIPNILSQGFTGLFIDALDIPIYLEQVNPAAYAGMTQAAISLVIAIRTAFPSLSLMINRAYPILQHVGGYVDYALGESVYTTYNFCSQQYEYVSSIGYQWALSFLQGAQALFPKLIVMSLDYWNPNDPMTIRKIYKKERTNGFCPYVSTVSLNQIVSEP